MLLGECEPTSRGLQVGTTEGQIWRWLDVKKPCGFEGVFVRQHVSYSLVSSPHLGCVTWDDDLSPPTFLLTCSTSTPTLATGIRRSLLKVAASPDTVENHLQAGSDERNGTCPRTWRVGRRQRGRHDKASREKAEADAFIDQEWLRRHGMALDSSRTNEHESRHRRWRRCAPLQ